MLCMNNKSRSIFKIISLTQHHHIQKSSPQSSSITLVRMASNKEMSLEKIYQKKSQLEHILLRPDTYIGSVELLKEEMWVWDTANEKMVKREISFVPGLYKIFDEIIVNAADNKQRDPNMSLIRINIDQNDNTIRVYNNGKGIPVAEHKEEKVLIPTLIFGHLLTSSNYNDDEKKVTGGRNGYGAKLCNIFSKKFVVETSSREYKKSYKQVWTDNMSKAEDPVVRDAKDEDFTCITFQPDLAKFKMTRLDDDIVALMSRRAYDIAASTPGIKVYLNNNRVPVNKFEDYCRLYMQTDVDEFNNPIKLVYEKPNERWEVAITCSDMGFQQVSFVNSIATTKGGRHVDYIVDQVVKHLSELINKKNKNGGGVKPFQIKQHMWLFINCLIENPTFDSQTKENMTLQAKNFGSKCTLTEEFFKKVTKNGLLDKVQTWLAYKERTDLEKAGSKSKVNKIKGIPKLDDANDAGTKDSMSCTLIVTEGDSAKTLAVAGLGVIGRDKYGVFPLRGKMLNVREATAKQIIENAEVSNLLKIIGLNYKEKYETRESLKQLRYGKLMIMTDQDHDGSHIKGLLINFVHNQWPNLLKHGFVEEFITPIVKVSKGNQERSFYSMPEFEEWQNKTDNWMTWKIKYYKGLGTSTSKEAKEYFSDFQRHRIKFEYGSARDDLAIQLAFSKRFIEERKDWLTRFMEDRRRRREENGRDEYLYQKETRAINYTDFINKELVLFSNLDNERSIPSLVDGFKPGQRKVMFTCFKRNLVREIKVAQLAGSVAELSAYHHGEQSLMHTIVNLAQNFVGSNNINLLLPIGQFGTRLHGGKDSASARYIFTALNSLTRLLFNPKDDPLLAYINDDGIRVEPEWYIPILPTVLVNGAEGIGTGWSTKIPNYNPREIIANLRRMLEGESPVPMRPYYKNFRGQVDQLDDVRVLTSGEIAVIGENTIEITELPIGVWTQAYKESVLEPFLHGQDEQQTCITDYKEYHTDVTVRFVVKMTPEQFQAAQRAGLHKFFKLQKTISLNSMVLFDENGCLRRYETATHILREFFTLRRKMYSRRKEYMEGMLGAEACKLDNIARFIVEKIEGKIKVENLKKSEICRILKERKYDPDPITRWKKKIARERGYEDDGSTVTQPADGSEEAEVDDGDATKKDYDYILGMPIWNLTMEKKDDILKQQKQKGDELAKLKAKTSDQLWIDDLDQFMVELDKFETKEKEDENVAISKAYKASLANKAGTSKAKALMSKTDRQEYLPSNDGKRVDVQLDPTLVAKSERETKSKIKEEATTSTALVVKKETSIVDVITDNGRLDDKTIEEIVSSLNKPQKKKAAAAEKPAKEKKVKEEAKTKEEPNGGSDDEQVVSTKPVAAKKEKKAAVPSSPGGDGEKKPAAKKAAGGAKKGAEEKQKTINNYFKKKNTSFSGSDDDEITLLESDDDEPVEKRSAPSRARKACNYNLGESDDETTNSSVEAAKKKKKKVESDEEILIDETSNSSDEFKMESKKPTKAASKPAKAQSKRKDDSDEIMSVKSTDDSNSHEFAPIFKTTKTAVTKTTSSSKLAKKDDNVVAEKPTAAAAKSKNKRQIDDDDESDTENKKPPPAMKKQESSNNILKMFSKPAAATKPAAAATKPAAKPKKKEESDEDVTFIDDGSDDDFMLPKKQAPSRKKLLAKIESPPKRAKRDVPKNQLLKNDDLFDDDDD